MPANHNDIEKRLWQVADELRANSKLKSSEYATPVLGLIFLRYASEKFAQVQRELEKKQSSLTIKETLDLLPRSYSKEIYAGKCDVVYQHVFDSYFGAGKSIYT